MLVVKRQEKEIQTKLKIVFDWTVIKIGEIIFLDKEKADNLLLLGFKYTERIIDGRHTYVFIQTPTLIKELSTHYDKGSFFINKNVCF